MIDYTAGQRRFRAFLNGYGIVLVKTEDCGMMRDDDGWEHFAWKLTVRNRYAPDSPYDRTDTTGYTLSYRQGVGHTKAPRLTDLMGSLLSDAACVSEGFEGFCADLGYDPDSRKAEALYKQIEANNAKLCKLFRTTDLASVLEKAQSLMEAAGL